MRSSKLQGVSSLACVLALAGCSSKAATTATSSGAGGATPAFNDQYGESAPPSVAYPQGPYGTHVGEVVANFALEGYPSPKASMAALGRIQLADFYNPHGRDASYAPAAGAVDDRLWPTDSPYENAGQKKPLALLIEVGSVWCGPCNQEAGTVLPAKHTTYLPCGGEFMLSLEDGPNAGVAALPNNLTSWTKTYKVDYPGGLDPQRGLDQLFVEGAYPENIIIDLTTMKIAGAIPGVPSNRCGTFESCTTDADCQKCTGLCSDTLGPCTVATDCSVPATCDFQCGDGASCMIATDCTAKKCSPSAFWQTYESLLDKTRPGCTLP